MRTIVTPISNVQTDEDGNFLTDEQGSLMLKNEEDIGILTKTHITQVNQVENNMIVSGISSLSEVYWNLRRTPSPALVSPNDLAWVTLDASTNVADEDDETEYEFEAEDYEGDELEVAEDNH